MRWECMPKRRLQVTHIGEVGYGVRALERFRRHELVAPYLGEATLTHSIWKEVARLITSNEPMAAREIDNVVILDSHWSIDARKYGSIARFCNHACGGSANTVAGFR
jgi:hypothetical protein